MASTSATENLIKIATHFGGRRMNLEDIEWATDLPAGKRLVDWIAAQLDPDVEQDGAGGGVRTHSALQLAVSLKDVSLESEEISSLRLLKSKNLSQLSANAPVDLSEYSRPSEIRARIEAMNSESELLESKAALLKYRLEQTKLAAQSASLTLKSLQDTLVTLNEHNLHEEEVLQDLSLCADSAIASSVTEALQLITTSDSVERRGPKTLRNSQIPPDDLLVSLKAFAGLRSQIVHHTEDAVDAVARAEAALPTLEQLSTEGTRLRDALSQTSLHEAAYENVYREELVHICRTFAEGSSIQSTVPVNGEESVPLNVADELRHAWALDQAAILLAREQVLDKAITAFRDILMPPLSKYFESLSSEDTHVNEAQALATALNAELEDLLADVQDGKERQSEDIATTGPSMAHYLLESRLINMLKQESDKPDLLQELRYQADRGNEAFARLENTIRNLPKQLHSALRDHLRLQSTTYANSPLNTSPPFWSASNLAELQSKIAIEVATMHQDIARLQKQDSQLSSRTTRKCSAFVQKYS
ncbi:hypothetical protein HWV62_44013 [Athelia sp. TMB]|nr:hypothetical protein HWV62_44013 [Athelia sp. TMB]